MARAVPRPDPVERASDSVADSSPCGWNLPPDDSTGGVVVSLVGAGLVPEAVVGPDSERLTVSASRNHEVLGRQQDGTRIRPVRNTELPGKDEVGGPGCGSSTIEPTSSISSGFFQALAPNRGYHSSRDLPR